MMKFKAAIPKKSASLLLLKPKPPSKISFFDYDILVLQRNVSFIKLSKKWPLHLHSSFQEAK